MNSHIPTRRSSLIVGFIDIRINKKKDNHAVSRLIGTSRVKRIVFLLFALIATHFVSFGQVDGDYQTLAAGTWSANTTWQVRSGGAWVNCLAGDYPGANAGAGVVSIRNGHNVTLDVSPANAIASLAVASGATNTILTIPTSYTLSVTGQTSISANTAGINKSILINGGTFNTASIALNGAASPTADAFLELSSGVVNVSGNIHGNQSSTRTYILFTSLGTGTLNIGGTITGGGITSTIGGGTTPTSGTINYSLSGDQTIGAYIYNNLTFSGSGIKSISSIDVTGILSLEGTSTVAVSGTLNFWANSTLQYKGSATQTTGVEFPATFNRTGGVIIDNSNGVLLGSSKTISYALNLKSGALSIGNNTLTLNGNLTYSGGSLTGGASSSLIFGAGTAINPLDAILGGLNNFTTSRNITLGANLSIAGNLSIIGSTLDLGSYTSDRSAVGGTLSLDATSSLLIGSTNSFPANYTTNTLTAGCLVNYYGAAQTVQNLTYSNLTLSGSGLKTLTATPAVNAILSMEGTATAFNAPNYGANATLRYMGSAAQITGPEFVTPWAGTGGVRIENVNGVTLNAIKTISPTSSLTIGGLVSNSIFSDGGNQITCTGTLNLTSGTLKLGAGTATTWPLFGTRNIANGTTVEYASGAAQSISVVPAYRNLTFSGAGVKTVAAASTLSVAENWDVNSPTTLTTTAIANVTGNITGTGAITMTGAGAINVSGNFSNSGVFTPSTSTVNYNGTIQNIKSTTYNNLTTSNGGTKTLLGDASVTGTLTLTSGVLQLGNRNLTVATIGAGTFTSTNMIATDGTGYLIRTATLAATLYPIGGGGYYSPASISEVAPAGTISARAVSSSSLDANLIKKYWDVLTSVVGKTTTAAFTFDPAEGSIGTNIWYKPNAGVWQTPPPLPATSTFGGNIFTVNGTPINTTTATSWSVGGIQSLYSYKSGSWTDPTTWTSDPSGTTQQGTAIPGDYDVVEILSGRTVTLPGNVTSTNLSLTINAGGILDLSTYTFPTLTSLSGQGTLKIASAYFPTATTNNFTIVDGGTAEYTNTSDFTIPAITFNHLRINAPGRIATQLGTITLNGDLHVKQGTYQINDGTANRRSLTINGNVTVDAGASLTVGLGNTVTGTTDPLLVPAGVAAPPFTDYYNTKTHRVVIKGDFTNNGTVKFTNQSNPVYNAFPADGAATVYFQGLTNNTLTCNGVSNFYNLVLDKGTDQTFSLSIYSTAYSNFKLFGANNAVIETSVANPNVRKALWIRNGTLTLKGLVVIPSLSEGIANAMPTSDFFIPSTGALLLDGPSVIVLSTADNFAEVNAAYGLSVADNATYGINDGTTPTVGSGISILGRLELMDGYLSTRESAGLRYWSYASGQFILNNGTVDTKQFNNPEGTNVGLVGYSQYGGNILIRGRFRNAITYTLPTALPGDLAIPTLNTARQISGIVGVGGVGAFHVNDNSASGYTVSGGTMSIYDVCGNTAFFVGCPKSNINVTGGTVQIIPTSGTVFGNRVYEINTLAPFGNLIVNRVNGPNVQLITNPLVVLNDFTLQSGTFDANSLNLTIGGNFTIASGTTYTTGTNITKLNGTTDQTFSVDLGAALALSSFTIDKPAGVAVNFAGSQKTINVSGNFRLALGTLYDNGNTINLSTGVYNSGIHTGTAAGKIVLNGTAAQTIDGGGVFNNLELNNNTAVAAPISLAANTTINGVLTFSRDKLFNIGIYNLKLNANATISNGGTLRYIQTAGNSGDGGVTKVYSTTSTSFVFPIGAPTINPIRAVKYTPATIGFSSNPTTYGSVTVIPGGYEHPATTSVVAQSLTYFWRVKSSGFAGIVANSVTHSFQYDDLDIVGAEASYVPALYDRTAFTWNIGTTATPPMNNGTNTFNDWTTPGDSRSILDADYTAGLASSFGTPTKFFSIATGAWRSNTTWSYTSGGLAVPAGAVAGVNYPGDNSIVIIENNNTVSFGTPPNYLTNANTETNNCASLQIRSGATLDTRYNPGSNFGMVLSHPSGNGNFRVTTSSATGSTIIFPSGDFSDFNSNRGTTEFYTTNAASNTIYRLPTNTDTYGTVIVSPLGGSNMAFPNIGTVNILGDLITRGQNTDSWLCMTWGPSLPTPGAVPVAKTMNIRGSMLIQGGSFIFVATGANAQKLIIDGDLIVSPGAGLDIAPFGGTNSSNCSIDIGGNFINNTNNDKPLAGGWAGGRVRLYNNATNNCVLTFFGNTPSSFTNTGLTPATGSTPITNLGYMIVNKGSSQTPTLTFNISGTLTQGLTDNWLTLQNGTLIYSRTGNLAINTTTDFTIPATAGLTVNTPSNVNISNNAGSETLYLNGKLRVQAGNVYIGPAGNTANNADVEYSDGGFSEIEVSGGNLFVNGQIRRPLGTTNGNLKFTQSGGNIYIYGNNPLATNLVRAKLEVVNNGSAFNMSGGTLYIVRGGGTTFGDLFLRPQNSTVTGGDIVFSQTPAGGTTIDAVQSYSLDANTPLNNITITGKTAATARNATVTLMVNPLILNGNLTLSNNRSFLDAKLNSNIPITIKGNFTNNGTYTPQNNLTTFSGNTQIINGTTTPIIFYDLTINPITSVTSTTNNLTVQNNLILSSGTFDCTGRQVSVAGDFINNGRYTDANAVNTGVRLNGTTLQYISGTGSFGRLEINNASGVEIDNDITLQGNLLLTNGVLNIKQHLLTLGQNSIIEGPQVLTTWGLTKMIITDGVFSNIGLKKFFSSGLISFIYPIGTAGKYTPAILSATASGSVASIRINNINASHPSITDKDNALKYFWEVESSGVSSFTGSLKFYYLDEDVVGGPESSYKASRLIVPDGSWSKTIKIVPTTNELTFDFGPDEINLCGEYTACNDLATPQNVPEFITNKSGDWNDNSIWTQTNTPEYTLAPGTGPNGFIVVIREEDVVTTTTNYCSAYKTTINGTLRALSPTYGHNFGTVTGNGTLYLNSGLFPAGRFTDFFDCVNDGTLEYGGNTDYAIVADLFDHLPNLLISGSGTRILPDKDLTICDTLQIGTDTDNPILDNSVNNRKLTIYGTILRKNTSVFKAGTGSNATVTFGGTTLQSVGAFEGTSSFNNLEVNNNQGISINSSENVEVNNKLLLTSGLINTTSTNKLTITNTAVNCVTPAGGSATSYVNGPLIKKIIQGDNFLFPIGKDNTAGNKLSVSATATGPLLWSAEYFEPNPTYQSLSAPLQGASAKEFWTVKAPSGSQAFINIKWDPTSDVTPLITPKADIRVARYTPGAPGTWGALSTNSVGDNFNGTASTTILVTSSATGSDDYTLGSLSLLKPRAKLTPGSSGVCGTDGIPITITKPVPTPFDYRIGYSVDGGATQFITINALTALPYKIPTTENMSAPYSRVYNLVSFTYNNPGGPVAGVVDATPVTAYTRPTTANAGPDQPGICGVTTTTLAASPIPPPSIIGTGLWSVVSGLGGTVITPSSQTSSFIGQNGRSYTLRWTVSNGTCKSTDDVVVNFTIKPNKPTAPTPQTFCAGSTVANLVATPPALSTVDWYDAATGGTKYATTTSLADGTYYGESYSGAGCSSTSRVAVVVNVTPDVGTPAFTLGGTSTRCQGLSTINYGASATNTTGITYSLDGASIGGGNTINASTGDVTFAAGWIGTSTITASAAGCNGPSLASHDVTTIASPTALISLSPDPTCDGDALLITVTLTGSTPNDFAFDITKDNGITAVTTPFSEPSYKSLIYNNTDNPLWFNDGLGTVWNEYTYTVTNLVDNTSGCSGADASETVTVYVKPVTGPQYHISNSFGY